jgi:hypothetical protein
VEWSIRALESIVASLLPIAEVARLDEDEDEDEDERMRGGKGD